MNLNTCDWAILNINWPCKLLQFYNYLIVTVILQSKDDEDSRLSSRRGDYDPTELFNKVGTVPSSAPSKHGRPHHRSSHGGQKPPSGHPGGGQPQPHHGSHGHHRSSSSSSSQSGHNAVQTAASAPPGASGTGSTGSQHPMQHPISKHPNPAMQFDPNMRSSHREFLIYVHNICDVKKFVRKISQKLRPRHPVPEVASGTGNSIRYWK